jgi:lipopolysaccharide/colanic/teichoic acid biosynthesis glycosyltransferase
MSLIGPRPERLHFEEKLEQKIYHNRLYHLIRPGLCRWAQVNYPYAAFIEDTADKLNCISRFTYDSSIWLNLLVTVKTLESVLNAQGTLSHQELTR